MYDEKFFEDLKYGTYLSLTKTVIDYLGSNKGKIFDLRKLGLHCAPSDIDDYFVDLGWKRDSFDTNGWQQDTWYYYSHKDYGFEMVMEYSGFYGGLRLYRGDIDD